MVCSTNYLSCYSVACWIWCCKSLIDLDLDLNWFVSKSKISQTVYWGFSVYLICRLFVDWGFLWSECKRLLDLVPGKINWIVGLWTGEEILWIYCTLNSLLCFRFTSTLYSPLVSVEAVYVRHLPHSLVGLLYLPISLRCSPFSPAVHHHCTNLLSSGQPWYALYTLSAPRNTALHT